jgi:hypothetical protein
LPSLTKRHPVKCLYKANPILVLQTLEQRPLRYESTFTHMKNDGQTKLWRRTICSMYSVDGSFQRWLWYSVGWHFNYLVFIPNDRLTALVCWRGALYPDCIDTKSIDLENTGSGHFAVVLMTGFTLQDRSFDFCSHGINPINLL